MKRILLLRIKVCFLLPLTILIKGIFKVFTAIQYSVSTGAKDFNAPSGSAMALNFKGKKLIPFAGLLLIANLFFVNLASGQTPPYINAGTYTFVVPAGVTSITIECWGAGGAGGGNPNKNNDGGGGGGGGGYSRSNFNVVPGDSYTVFVGAGGTGSIGKGVDGEDTWVTDPTILGAKGGMGGIAAAGGSPGAGGAGGISGIGFNKQVGGNGGIGLDKNGNGEGGPGGSSAGPTANGTSGPSPWSTITAAAAPTGGGKGGNGGDKNKDGLVGNSFGGGGGGAGGGKQNGGNGADGQVIISWIKNNYLDITSGIHLTRCSTVAENATATLNAPAGLVFVNVDFASYGTPTGYCPNFIIGGCNAANSQSVVEGYLLGTNSASIPAKNAVFVDPCGGTVKNLYIAATYFSSMTICVGNTVTVKGSTPLVASGTPTYIWESSTTSSSSGFSTISGATSINYTTVALSQTTWYRRTVISGVINDVSVPIKVTVNSLPQGSISANGPFCATGAGQLTWTATSGTGPYTVVYNDGVANRTATAVVSGTAFATVTTPVVSTTTYTLVSVTGAGCMRSAGFTGGSATITVNSLPQGSISANGPFCATGAGQLTWTATSGTGPYTVVYNDGVANRTATAVVSGTAFATVTTPVVSTTTYTLVSVTGAGCIRSAGFTSNLATININALPTINTTGTATDICYNLAAQITTLAYSAITDSPISYSIIWTALPANSFAAVTNFPLPASSINISVPANTAAGIYTGTITVKNDNGCVSTGNNFTVTVNGNFTSGTILSTGQTICYNGDPLVIGSSTDANGGDLAITYQWQSSIDAAFTAPVTIVSNTATYDPPSGLIVTTYYRRLAKDNTCNNTFASSAGVWQVTITPLLSSVSIAPSIDQSICANGSGTLLTVTETDGGLITGRSWGIRSVSGGTITAISGATSQTYTPKGADLTVGTWYVVCTSTPTCGPETKSNEVKVVVNSGNIANAGPAMAAICTKSTSAKLGGSNGGPATWSSPDGTFSDVHDLNATFTPTLGFFGTAVLTLTPDDGSCSLVPDSKPIEVEKMHTLTLGTPLSYPICQDKTAKDLDGDFSGGAKGAVWSDGTIGGTFTNNLGLTPKTATWTPPAGWVGTATLILTSQGVTCNVVTRNERQIVVNPTVGTPTDIIVSSGVEPTCQLTDGITTTTYATTASNSTGFNWTLSNATAGAIDASTGIMTWAFDFSGSVDIQVTAKGCNEPSAQKIRTVTVTPLPVATINYVGKPFCNSVASAVVTITGNTSGSFMAAPTGLTLDATSGAISPSGSTAGTYLITYTIASAGGCGDVIATTSIIIKALPLATFSYLGSPYCSNASNPSPTFSSGGSAGTFSSTIGLVINTATGQIDLAASTAGTYDVTNKFIASGGCAEVTATSSITITTLPVATFNYAVTPYCSNAVNPQATLSVGGVGGTFSSTPGLVILNTATGLIDLLASIPGTYTVTNAIDAASGCEIVKATSPITITALPAAAISYAGTPFCNSLATAQTVTLTGTYGGTYTALPAGLSIDATTGAITPGTSTAGTYTITYTIATAVGCAAVTANTSVIITSLPDATFSYADSPFCSDAANPMPTLVGVAGTFSSTPGLVFVNATTGEIDISASLAGTYTLTNTIPASNGCGTGTFQSSVTINTRPTITVDYCTVKDKIRITATGGVSYEWLAPLSGPGTVDGSGGNYIDADQAGIYGVKVTNGTCVQPIYSTVSNDLVKNGNFTTGNADFTSGYGYVTNDTGIRTELNPEGLYAVDVSAYEFHDAFHGRDHTTGDGNFMIINGSTAVPTKTIWEEIVTVVPNTDYYFSAWGMNINPGSPAQLQFEVNGIAQGFTADLSNAAKPESEDAIALTDWIRFYSTPLWKSGPTTTEAIIRIINKNTEPSGNDFGLDDISFGTLNPPPASLISGSDDQTVCINKPIQNIVYSTERALSATDSGLPTGVTAIMASNLLTIRGNPSEAGTFNYTIHLTGCNADVTLKGKITVNPDVSAGIVSGISPLCIGILPKPIFTSSGTVGGSWSSTNTAVATVDAGSGEVTTIGTGTADITYTLNSGCGFPKSAYKTIIVSPNVVAGVVNGANMLCIGGPATYTCTIGGNWSSTNTAVATIVAATGVVTTLSAGTTNITYTISSGCNIPTPSFKTLTVSPNVSAGLVTGTSPVCINQTATYTSDGTAGGSWSSTNTAVASVNSSGLVTSIGAGTTDITYTVNSGCGSPISAIKTLTVSPNVNAGTISGTSPLCIGENATYSSNGETGGNWTSTNPAIASVDASTGVVSAVSAGTCNIVYTISSGCGFPAKAWKSVTVTPANTAGIASSAPTLYINTVLTSITHTTSGATGIGAAAGLPAGVTAAWAGNVITISGKPTEYGTFSYTIPLTGGCGSVNATGTIIVKPNDPPVIVCTTALVLDTDVDACTATRSPISPTLSSGTQPITWTWTIVGPGDIAPYPTGTFTGSVANPGPPSIGNYPFKQGETIITWRAENDADFDECTQTITVKDNQAPTFTIPDPFGFCVENLSNAIFKDAVNINNVDIYDPNDAANPRPDYYLVRNTELNLSTSSFADNCCTSNFIVRWKITYSDLTTLPALPAPFPYIEGQPSDYITLGNKIKLPGAVTSNVYHTITYWLVDCHGNVSDQVNVKITINPRPNIIKTTIGFP